MVVDRVAVIDAVVFEVTGVRALEALGLVLVALMAATTELV